ncbi:ATP synthase subunit C lysine N-methyltransferase-like [Ostrea edulis]|uniref:ATP synthase subunit C lysine N-methyltransferase-like n=1 Tax=Ostrea edulis TaxID=37623 RepID=UPI002094B654|nr:ATP synthase subunit C lysine N-methyltransferase-like [Ostrea edulis]XP_048777682.1 ATP synthase subunit C lysine N-methyltransferase-like [Ostrea edulis]XP_048777683.1 ATP synthase subunit C lysine N-methyltransferase-like [Ostrea edulis]
MESVLNETSSTERKPEKKSYTGYIITGTLAGIVFGIHLIAGPFITPALRRVCLPFVPASEEQVDNVFRMLKGRKGKFVDLGSGDGRLVREAAKKSFTAHGVEMNVWLVLYSKFKASREGLSSKATFSRTDLWKHSLQQYDNIVIFGVQSMMKELEKKIIAECKDDVRVVACRFPLPNIEPEAEIGTGVDTVWLYKIPKM